MRRAAEKFRAGGLQNALRAALARICAAWMSKQSDAADRSAPTRIDRLPPRLEVLGLHANERVTHRLIGSRDPSGAGWGCAASIGVASTSAACLGDPLRASIPRAMPVDPRDLQFSSFTPFAISPLCRAPPPLGPSLSMTGAEDGAILLFTPTPI
jgi:hypothetical protein